MRLIALPKISMHALPSLAANTIHPSIHRSIHSSITLMKIGPSVGRKVRYACALPCLPAYKQLFEKSHSSSVQSSQRNRIDEGRSDRFSFFVRNSMVSSTSTRDRNVCNQSRKRSRSEVIYAYPKLVRIVGA